MAGQERSFLDSLPELARIWLDDRSAVRTLARGEVLFHQGDHAHAMYVVRSGRFAVDVIDVHGDQSLIRLVDRGATLGELAIVVPDGRRSATVTAVQRSTVRVIHRREFEDMRRRWPDVDRLLAGDLAQRLIDLTDTSMMTVHRPVAERLVARLIAANASAGGHGTITLVQQQLADMVGASRQTVSTLLAAAEREGLIQVGRGTVTVLDGRALELWAANRVAH